MAGSGELVRRALLSQENSLRVLCRLMPQSLQPVEALNAVWSCDVFQKELASSKPVLGEQLGQNRIREGLSTSLLPITPLKGLNLNPVQCRPYHGLAATQPSLQESALAADHGNDVPQSSLIAEADDDASSERSDASGALPISESSSDSLASDSGGNGKENADLQDSPSTSGSTASEDARARRRASVTEDPSNEEPSEGPPKKVHQLRGRIHWVEIDDDGKPMAKDSFGTPLSSSFNEHLQNSMEQLEEHRAIEAQQARFGFKAGSAPAAVRWPEQLQPVGDSITAPKKPKPVVKAHAIRERTSNLVGNRSVEATPFAPSFKNAGEMEKFLNELLAAGQYETVQREFSAYKWYCQNELGRVSDMLTADMYTAVLRAFQHTKASMDRCMRLHQDMRSNNLVPSRLHYNTLLKVACQNTASGRAAMEVMEEMLELGVEPDHDTYNSAATACAWGKYSMSANRFIHQAFAKGLMPETKTLQEVLISLIRSMGDGAKRTVEAGSLLSVMLEQDVPIKMHMVQEVFTAAVDQDDVETTTLCLNMLAKRDFLDEGTLLAALNTAARCGDIDLMELVWGQLLKVVEPPPAAYVARLQALATLVPAKGGVSLERVFQEMAQMEAALRPRAAQMDPEEADLLFDPSKSYKWIIARLSRRLKALDRAYLCLTEMHQKGQPIPLLGLNCIIQGCVNVCDMNRAFQTFDEIHRTFKLVPNVHSYNALLEGCGQARQVAATKRTLEVMESAGVKPNTRSWELLASAHIIDRNPGQALVTIQEMVNRGFVPDKAILDALLRRSRREKYELGITTVVKLMKALGFEDNPLVRERRERSWQELQLAYRGGRR